MKIKFNNIRDLADARYAASVMADYIGFRIGGEDELPASTIQEIIGWCSGPAVILEVSDNVDIEKINALLNTLPVNGIETPADRFEQLKDTFDSHGLEWIVNSNISGDYITHNETLSNQNKHFCHVEPSMAMAESVKKTEPWGISINCFESVSTGIKDFSDLNDFFETIEIF